MALGRARRDGERDTLSAGAHPGEPGVGVDLAPPFVAEDDATAWLFSLNRFGIRPGLSRIEGLLGELGNPERQLKTLVVAGTNGKGSTTRVLARLLRAAGHKVVTYTSPHLLQVYERIQINEKPVDPMEFARRVKRIRPLTEKYDASWFETLTALAVEIARDSDADYFCCETGLGGRLDASNALPAVATLLTSVGLDHQRILGETLAEIAAEKLGLLKAGTPLFAAVRPELRGQVFAAAVTAGSTCYFADELTRWPDGQAEPDVTWDLVLRDRVFADLPACGTAAMRGNVALAMLALTELAAARGEDLMPAEPVAALGNLFLPGRFQGVVREPDWIFDTAHNAQALTHALQSFLSVPCQGRRLIVFGGMQDKTVSGELAPLLGGADHLVGMPISLPRARTAGELSILFSELGLAPGEAADLWTRPCVVVPELGAGLRQLALGLESTDRVLVCGSCFLVAEVLHHLGVRDLEDTREAWDGGTLMRALASGTPGSPDASGSPDQAPTGEDKS